MSSVNTTRSLAPGTRSLTFPNARSRRGGWVTSDVLGIDTYSCTTSEPVTGPVFVTVTVAVRLKSPLATVGVDSSRLEKANVVYERPCLSCHHDHHHVGKAGPINRPSHARLGRHDSPKRKLRGDSAVLKMFVTLLTRKKKKGYIRRSCTRGIYVRRTGLLRNARRRSPSGSDRGQRCPRVSWGTSMKVFLMGSSSRREHRRWHHRLRYRGTKSGRWQEQSPPRAALSTNPNHFRNISGNAEK